MGLSIEIRQGDTFRYNLQWVDSANTPIPLDNYHFKMQIKKERGAVADICTLRTNPPSAPGTRDGEIKILDSENGEFQLYIHSAVTRKFKFTTAVFDIFAVDQSTSPTEDIWLVDGDATLIESVTDIDD